MGEAFCLCEALPTVLQLTSQTALLAIAVPRIVELFVPYQVKYRDSAAPRIRSSFVSYNDVHTDLPLLSIYLESARIGIFSASPDTADHSTANLVWQIDPGHRGVSFAVARL